MTLLSGGVVGRVAFIGADGRQELMPVNFTVVDDAIYFRTSASGALSLLADGLGNVAFGVDGVDASAGRGWNVTARGEAEGVLDPAILRVVDASGMQKPWAGDDRGQVVKIVIHEIDGRRVTRE
ncbi:MAG: pyridoxamine 5'-phosphate oxidase family protein [Aeromicrobium sp.]